MRQSSLNEIFKNSGPLAVKNEFQVHYWALVYRHVATDGSLFDICIPTVFFNYKQVVSPAHIEFEMEDVRTVSEKVQPLHNHVLSSVDVTEVGAKLTSLFGVEFTPMSTFLNSIHRHPGSSVAQSFSGTDLDKNPKNHGVVFPFSKASGDLPNFAGIMAIQHGECRLAHNDYRVVNGTLAKDITYVKNRCQTIVENDTNNQSEVERMFAIAPSYYCVDSDALITCTDAIKLSNIAPTLQPNTAAIAAENVTERPTPVYKAATTTVHGFGRKIPTKPDQNWRLTLVQLREKYKALFEQVYGDWTAEDTNWMLLMDKHELLEEIAEMEEMVSMENDSLWDILTTYGVPASMLKDKTTEQLDDMLKLLEGDIDAGKPHL